MSQSLANPDNVPLFACTKCNSRHPFEQLSQGHQLCKDCKGSFQVIKCAYCRSEFQQDTAGKSGSICKKCELLQDQHGKPGPCTYCNIIAAFIGTKCQRCTNTEKKYGPPLSCEHCRQKCAFDRKDPESKKKVDGKILCWLCTMAYKRTLAKAKQKEAILKSSISGSSHHRMSGDSKSYSSSSRHPGSSSSNGHRHSSNLNNTSGSSSSHHRSSSHRSSQHSLSHSGPNQRESSSSSSTSKKPRMDLPGPSNGHMSQLSVESRFNEPNHNDLASVVTQLKDQVAHLNKRLQMKEKELLSKDQQIADLKSTNTREQRELREKINNMSKQHAEKISEMQSKLVAMQKQVASHTKSRSHPTTVYNEPPLVI